MNIFLLLIVLFSTTLTAMRQESIETIEQTYLPIEISQGKKWTPYYIPATNIAISVEDKNDTNLNDIVSKFTVFNMYTKGQIYEHTFERITKQAQKSFVLGKTIYYTDNTSYTFDGNIGCISSFTDLNNINNIVAVNNYHTDSTEKSINIFTKTPGGFSKKISLMDVAKIISLNKKNRYPIEQNIIPWTGADETHVSLYIFPSKKIPNPPYIVCQEDKFNVHSLQEPFDRTSIACFTKSELNDFSGWAIHPYTNKNPFDWNSYESTKEFGTWCIFNENDYVLTSYYGPSGTIPFIVKHAETNETIEIKGLEKINEFFKHAVPANPSEFFERKKEQVRIICGDDRSIIRICCPFEFSGEEYENSKITNCIAYFLVDLNNKTATILQLQKDYIPDERDEFIVDSLQQYELLNGIQQYAFCAYSIVNTIREHIAYAWVDLISHMPIHWQTEQEMGIIPNFNQKYHPKKGSIYYYALDLDDNTTIIRPYPWTTAIDLDPNYMQIIESSLEFIYFWLSHKGVAIYQNNYSDELYDIHIYDNPFDEPITTITCHDYKVTTDPHWGYFIHLLTSNPGEYVRVFHVATNSSEISNTTDIQEIYENLTASYIQRLSETLNAKNIQEEPEDKITSYFDYCSIQ